MHEVTQLSICYGFVLMERGEPKLQSPAYYDLGLIQPTLDQFRESHGFRVNDHEIVVSIIKYEFSNGIIYSTEHSRVDIYDGDTKLGSTVLDPVTRVIQAHPTYEQFIDYSTRNKYYSVYNGRYYDAIPVPHAHISQDEFDSVYSYTYRADDTNLPSDASEYGFDEYSSEESELIRDQFDTTPSGVKSEINVPDDYQPIHFADSSAEIHGLDQIKSDTVRIPVIQPNGMNKRQRRRFRAELRKRLQTASAVGNGYIPKLKTYSASRSTVVFEPGEHLRQLRSGALLDYYLEIYIKQPNASKDLVRSRRIEMLCNSRVRFRTPPTGNTEAMSLLS